MSNVIIVGIAFIVGLIIFSLAKKVLSKKKENKSKGEDTGNVGAVKGAVNDFFVPVDRYPKDVKDLPAKSLGGQPQFYNEVDHSRGRFIAWIRTKEDLADERVILNNFYRARVRLDVKYFWFIPAHKDELTPCVFRPNIDAVFKGPGEEVGVPTEGIVILKRSLDGTRLATGQGERFRQLLLDEKHKNTILADMMVTVRDKERIMGLADTSKEAADEIENQLKRTRKVHDAAMGRKDSSDISSPYGSEMYGDEDITAGTGSQDIWQFQG